MLRGLVQGLPAAADKEPSAALLPPPCLPRAAAPAVNRRTEIQLARELPGLAPDLAHSCGLFLHVGLPVMLQSIKGYSATMVEGQARRDRTYVQTEIANHRTDHAVVGALVARVWQLAPEVMAAIRLHHDMDALKDDHVEAEVRTLMALSLVADLLLRRRESLPPDSERERHGAAALAWLQIGAEELEAWHDLIAEELEPA